MVTTLRIKMTILSLKGSFGIHRITHALESFFSKIEDKALAIKVILTTVSIKELMMGKFSFPICTRTNHAMKNELPLLQPSDCFSDKV